VEEDEVVVTIEGNIRIGACGGVVCVRWRKCVLIVLEVIRNYGLLPRRD
jgi:hypothetical protein